MAEQFLTPSSSSKKFFNDVADELEKHRNSTIENCELRRKLEEMREFIKWIEVADEDSIRVCPGCGEKLEDDDENPIPVNHTPTCGYYRFVLSDMLASPSRREAYVTTEGNCSDCGSKLKNAETARLTWQGQAYELNQQLKTITKALGVEPPN